MDGAFAPHSVARVRFGVMKGKKDFLDVARDYRRRDGKKSGL